MSGAMEKGTAAAEPEAEQGSQQGQGACQPPRGPRHRVVAILQQGIGLVTDLYDLTVVNAVRPEIEDCYGQMSTVENGLLTSASHMGAIIGQLTFGSIADRFGRRGAFIATAVLMTVSAAGAASAVPVGNLSLVQVMIFWRFLLGIGIGGEYPLSGAVTAEKADVNSSATHMASLCLCFLLGQILAPTVVLLCLYTGQSSQVTWRVGIGGGAVLALLGASMRLSTMQESEAWLRARQSSQRQPSLLDRSVLRSVARPLAGTILAWFIYDVVGYGTGGYSSTLFQAETRTGTLWNLLKIIALSTPGYFFTLCVGRFGRRCFQLSGFLGMGIIFLIMGFTTGKTPLLFQVALFGLQKSFDGFGPGSMTFIIPAEIFPTAIRASCHGISAAGGKLGALLGTAFFPAYLKWVGQGGVLYTSGIVALLGAALTVVLTPPYSAETLQRLGEAETEAAAQGRLPELSKVLWARPGAQRRPARQPLVGQSA